MNKVKQGFEAEFGPSRLIDFLFDRESHGQWTDILAEALVVAYTKRISTATAAGDIERVKVLGSKWAHMVYGAKEKVSSLAYANGTNGVLVTPEVS